MDALYPNKYARITTNANQKQKLNASAVEIKSEPSVSQVDVSALEWSLDGFGSAMDSEDVPTEYLFDGGATDAVSNNQSILADYHNLPHPIPLKTAANDSTAVIVGKGQLDLVTEKGVAVIKDVYHCSEGDRNYTLTGGSHCEWCKDIDGQ